MSGAASSSISVLYVDDEPDFAELVAAQLERDGGLEVDAYTDPEEAFQRLEREGVDDLDCVVSDYEMPGLDGLELLEAVRERWPDLPFILYTAQGSEGVASEAISAGVTEYMQKGTDPQQFEVLANRIENAVEKYETERELERTEARYRRLVEQNLTGIYIVGAEDGDIKYANPKCAAVFGYDREELLELSAFDLVAEEDHDRMRERVRERLEGDPEELNYTLTGVRKDGERFEFEVHSGLVDYEGEPAMMGTLTDVTEQRERERELEEYRELVETVGDPMYVLDAEGYVEKANRAMAEMLGYDREALLGAHAGEFLPEADLEAGRSLVAAFVGDELDPPETIELDFLTADGERIPCEANITTLTDDEGAFRGTVGVVRVIAERKARERELEEYERIVETAPDGIFILDDEGYFVSGNETGAELVGYDREALLDEHYSTLVEDGVVDEEVVERYAAIVSELQGADSERQKAKFEATIRPPDGGQRDCEVHIALLPAEDGRHRGTVGVIRDITERKAIEEARRAERDRLSALFENIPEPTIVYEFVDGEPVVRRVNDAFEEAFGYEEPAIVGESLDDHIVPADRREEAADLNERVAAGEELGVEVVRETADGQRRDFLLRNAPIPVDGEGVHGYAIYTDITERKERERRLGALHEATRDLMEATARDEVAELAIDAAERVLGLALTGFYAPDEDGAALEPVAATDDARELFGTLPTIGAGEGIAWRVFETGEPVMASDVRDHEDVYDPDTPVRSEMLLPVGDHGVFMAASQRVDAFGEAEQSLARVLASNVEVALDRAHREALLREREQALLRQNERLEEFAGVVSHDLRSPLTVAKGNAHLLRETGDEEYLEKIEQALDRMERLIDDLLGLARRGATVDDLQRVDVYDAALEAWSTVDTAGAALEVDLEGAVVQADGSRLRELLENLFTNAVEHGGDEVTVRVGPLEDGFYVEDDGEGLDPETRDHLFEPGFTTAEEGTGFGLSIVRQIAEAHGWEVAATEGADGGARFEFTGVELGVQAEP